MAKAPRLERRFVRVRRILRFLPKSILVTQVSVESGRTNGTGKIDNQEKKRGGRGKGHTHMRSRHLLIPITNKLVQKMVRKLPWLPYIPPQRHINQISPFIKPIIPPPSPYPNSHHHHHNNNTKNSPSGHQYASTGCSSYTGYGFSRYVFHSAAPTTLFPASVSTTCSQLALLSARYSRISRSQSSVKPAGVGSGWKRRQRWLGGVA